MAATLSGFVSRRRARAAALLFAALMPSAARAADPPESEVWVCQGVYQTAPGTPVQPQDRTLTIAIGADRALMKSGEGEFQGRHESSGPHLAAWFEVPGPGGERLMEEVTLGRVTGRLAGTRQRADGTRVGVYRGGCRPAQESAGR